jgi:hypothetical protein
MRTLTFACATLVLLAACGGESAAPHDDTPSTPTGGEGGEGQGTGGGDSGGGGSGPACSSHSECAVPTPFCDPVSGECVEPPPGSELGWGDGSAASVTWTVISDSFDLKEPVDLGFDPSAPNLLWIVNKQDDSMLIITDPGTETMTEERRHDPAASHFMANPPAFAFGAVDETWGQTFGICGDGDNGNDFMGPALFSSRLDVFAEPTPDGLGSHLDMLHSTTFCRGIAHASGNVFFAFNSAFGSIDKYDFGDDHDPGNDDHSDGRILRYVSGTLVGVDDVSSHLAFDAATGWLYIADTGQARVVVLDTATGTPGVVFNGLEPVAERRTVAGATTFDLLPPGSVVLPSGLELHRGLVFVSDSATSRFSAFDGEGNLVRSLDTGLPAGSLSGFTFGPDGKLYLVDSLAGRVLRIDPVP